MSTLPLVSVIVPVYNVERYLSECIDSILAQTYSHVEVILVNDGSTDSSPALCEHYGRLDQRIRVIHKENGGLSSARNEGLNTMHGDLLTFVDSDDWIDSCYLEELVHGTTESECVIPWGRFSKVSEDGLEIPNPNWSREQPPSLLSAEAQNELNVERYASALLMTSTCKLFPVKVFGDLRFPEGRLHEDDFVAHRWVASATKVVRVNQAVYYYRQRSGSSMTSSYLHMKRCKDNLDAILDRIDFYESANLVQHIGFAAMLGLRRGFGFLVDAATWSGSLGHTERETMLQHLTVRAKRFSRYVRKKRMLENETRRGFYIFASFPTAYVAWTKYRRSRK